MDYQKISTQRLLKMYQQRRKEWFCSIASFDHMEGGEPDDFSDLDAMKEELVKREHVPRRPKKKSKANR